MRNMIRMAVTWMALAAAPVVAQVAVFPLETSNVTDAEAGSAQLTFLDAVRDQWPGGMIQRQVVARALQQHQEHRAAASALRAREYIVGQLVRLEKDLWLTAHLYGPDGTQRHQARMRVANLDDLPTVATRLVRALEERTSPEKTATLDSITLAEARPLVRRRGGGGSHGVRFGSIAAMQKQTEWLGTFGYTAIFEQDSNALAFGVTALFPAGIGDAPAYGGLVFDLGYQRFLSEGAYAPYLGAGLEPRIVSGFRFVPYVKAGLVAPRWSSARLFGELRVAQNVLPLPGNARPTEVGLHLGVTFQ